MEVCSFAVHRRLVADAAEKRNAKANSPVSEDSVTGARLLVSVVDDDESVRESLPDLLKELGYDARAFSSAEDFLASDCVTKTACLLLDITMPGMSGPELQQELTRRGQTIPIVFITARRDENMRLRLIRQGAVECLFKPFDDRAVIAALNSALGK
jgi:FixJ family two-component response regulator